MEVYSDYVTDVVFGEGPLYFSIQKSDNDHVTVKGFKKTEGDKHPPIERIGAVSVGDYIIRINSEDVIAMSYSKVKKILSNAPRPLTLRFAKPSPPSECKKVVVDGETYVKEWATVDLYLPVRKYDLTSIKVEELPDFHDYKEMKTVFTPLTENGNLFECEIRDHCFNDKKDTQTRATMWKLLLNYYPYAPAEWKKHNEEKINEYKEFVNEFIVKRNNELGKTDCQTVPNPLDVTWKKELPEGTKVQDNESPWSKDFGDNDLRDIIWKDTLRTFSDHEFFTPENQIVFSRILYIFAKLNAGIKYVQGMNELLAPIVIVFANANKEATGADMSIDVEVASFYCFNTLMSETKDLFIRQLDSDNSGINGVFHKLDHYVDAHVHEVYEVMKEQELETQFYALRWMTTLYAHEFTLEDTFRLWDCLLADPQRFQYMYCFGAAMLKAKSNEIIANSFMYMKLLQDYKVEKFKKLLKMGNKIRVEELRLTNDVEDDNDEMTVILDKTKEYLNKTKDLVGEQVKKGWLSFKTVGIPKLNEFAKNTMSKATELSKDWSEKGKVLGKDWSEKGKVLGKDLAEKSKVLGKDLAEKSKVLGKDLAEKGKVFGKDFSEKSKEYSKKFMNTIKERAETQKKAMSERKNSQLVQSIDEDAVTDTSDENEELSMTEEDNGFEDI